MANLQDPNGLQLVDIVLTNLALQYSPEGFIANDLVSSMDVAKNHGIYPTWTQDDFFRDDVDPAVADRAETPEIDFAYTTASYQLVNRRLKVSISPEEQDQAHSALRFRETKINGLLDRFALNRERRLAAALRDTTNGGSLTGGKATPTVKWDAGTSGTPATIEKDIKAARKAVRDATGQMLDTIVFDWDVAYAIAVDPTIRDIIKYTVPGDMIVRDGEAILPKRLHGLDVVIAGGQGGKYSTAREGGTMSLSNIWGKSARLIKRVPDNSWGKPATLYSLRGNVATFAGVSNIVDGESPVYNLVDHWFTPDPPVEHVRVWDKRQDLVTAPALGYELNAVIS